MKRTLSDNSEIEVPKGYRAYKIKGVDDIIISRKGGPTAEQIKTEPNYQKLRDNQKEFGVASMMAKTLRDAFSEGMSEICESYVSGKLTAQFRNLTRFEEGKIGTRPIFVSKHGHHLNGFEFNSTATYEHIFGAKYFIKPGSRRGQVIIHFPSFIPEETFVKPDEATNFKITARLVAISDYTYDDIEDSYKAIDDEVNGKYGSYESKMFPLLKISVDPMTTMLSVNQLDLPEGSALFLVMAVSFYKYENGKFTHLAKDSAMSIRRVY
ncbi:hypothetical protein [Marinoscillum sp. MHG1-6]|uniref:hypothetical protein n=1 Tax=Marinoscillum sp. MHG1-6 TaxID=2959627 RepID=UPI0021573B06|nr:hypothetical protein [Marinoscillum sp. MHG1-6]